MQDSSGPRQEKKRKETRSYLQTAACRNSEAWGSFSSAPCPFSFRPKCGSQEKKKRRGGKKTRPHSSCASIGRPKCLKNAPPFQRIIFQNLYLRRKRVLSSDALFFPTPVLFFSCFSRQVCRCFSLADLATFFFRSLMKPATDVAMDALNEANGVSVLTHLQFILAKQM